MRNIFFLFIFLPAISFAALKKKEHVKYITQIGSCPSKIAARLSLKLVEEFERSYSLKKLKEFILKERLEEKYFLSQYKINYNPIKKLIHFKYDCPKPLMAVHLLKDDGKDHYKAILVDTGVLYDPNYEVVLRYDNKIKRELPSLVLPIKKMESDLQQKLTELVGNMPSELYHHLSEMIYDQSKELTLILSVNDNPSSVYLGDQLWDQKLIKLTEIVGFMEEKNKIPRHINMINLEKIVVKFSL